MEQQKTLDLQLLRVESSPDSTPAYVYQKRVKKHTPPSKLAATNGAAESVAIPPNGLTVPRIMVDQTEKIFSRKLILALLEKCRVNEKDMNLMKKRKLATMLIERLNSEADQDDEV